MKKDILIVFALVLIATVLIMGVNFQSVDEYYLEHADDIQPDSETVTLAIRCDTVLSPMDELDKSLREGDYVPPDVVILPEPALALRSGDTVFDVLYRAVRSYRIPFEYQGADKNRFGGVYVEGINYLYEFSCGPNSGWVYRVNGEFPSTSCSNLTLQDGDRIEWLYTCDLGMDVGNIWEGEP